MTRLDELIKQRDALQKEIVEESEREREREQKICLAAKCLTDSEIDNIILDGNADIKAAFRYAAKVGRDYLCGNY